MQAVQSNHSFFGFDSSINLALVFSLALHFLIFFVTALGLPMMIKEDPMILNPPITIELVEFAELTQTPKIAPPIPQPEDQKETPPQVVEEKPPVVTETEEKPKTEETKESVPESVPDPSKKPDLKKEEKPKKEEKKPDPSATKVEKEEPQKDFASLLKNLTPEVKEEPKPRETDIQDVIDELAPDTPINRLGDQLTLSEQDALRHQLAQCWNVMAGAKYAEDLVVEVRAVINRDRTIAQASILDQGRYNRDSHFRAAAEGALRALRNPRCSPLALPPEKYNEWKTTVIVFDPREML